jgi:hypothetical protein
MMRTQTPTSKIFSINDTVKRSGFHDPFEENSGAKKGARQTALPHRELQYLKKKPEGRNYENQVKQNENKPKPSSPRCPKGEKTNAPSGPPW